jgi:hypothetical protein
MIYCVGKKVLYEGYFENQMRPIKPVGGSVWKTEEEAQAHCFNGFNVYGVFANWETDTRPSEEGGNWHDLLINAELIQLDNLQV